MENSFESFTAGVRFNSFVTTRLTRDIRPAIFGNFSFSRHKYFSNIYANVPRSLTVIVYATWGERVEGETRGLGPDVVTV